MAASRTARRFFFTLLIAATVLVAMVARPIASALFLAGMHMNGAVVFFALIGGLGAFGGVGLLLGPLVMALFLTLLRMYQRDFKRDPRPTASP